MLENTALFLPAPLIPPDTFKAAVRFEHFDTGLPKEPETCQERNMAEACPLLQGT